MFASSLGPRARRRGIVLVLILGMLGLVALIGVTFATFAGQSLKGSRDFMQGVARPSAEVLMDYALAQLINDTSNPMSAIRGHSLLRDMYGNDSVFRGANPTISAAAATRGHLDTVYYNGNPAPLTVLAAGMGSATGTLNQNSGTPYYNQVRVETNIPTGNQYFGLNFTRWIMTVPASPYLVAQTFEILEDDVSGINHVFTLSNNLGNPAGAAAPFTSADTNTGTFNNPNYYESGAADTRLPIVLNGSAPGFNIVFSLDAQYMRAFNGPGMTRPDYGANAVYPANFAAYGNLRLAEIDPDVFGMDEDYDACDLENWFMAIQSADGQVIVPSFHRPGIIVRDTVAVDNPTPSTALENSDWNVRYNYKTSNAADELIRSVKQRRASKILRPRQVDHSPLFPPDPVPDPITGKLTFDIDNDGDGVTDSVWLDLGFPIQRDPGGKIYKPLFAFMVLGLNGRLPLNTAGNLQARANGNSSYNPTAFTQTDAATRTVPFRDTGSQVAVPQAGAYTVPMGANKPYLSNSPIPVQAFVSETWADAPVWDHASHLGYSVNEINPKYALQNAPNNLYGISKRPDGVFPESYYAVVAGELIDYSQHDDAGVDVALTQLRNILAGTVPTDIQNPIPLANYPITGANVLSNQDLNGVRVKGDYWVFPNNVLDPSEEGWPAGRIYRSNGAVAGRWGEAEGVPTLISTGTIYNAASLYAIAPYTNPVRAGRSHFSSGYGSNDITDDDFDSTDPFFTYPGGGGVSNPYATVAQPVTVDHPARLTAEAVDSFDLAGAFQFASDRIRRFNRPIDPSGTGRMVSYFYRPQDAHDAGQGHDRLGRVSFFRYFRPPGMPQAVSYPYPIDYTVTPLVTNFNKPLLSLAGATNYYTNNVLSGFAQTLLPGNLMYGPTGSAVAIANAQYVAPMAALPFNVRSDLSIPTGYQPLAGAPSVNPTGSLLVGTDWGPNLGTTFPAYMAPGGPVGPTGAAYNSTTNLGVVNGYLGGSLNKDEADEMDLYTPNTYDQPFGPSDLEWLYRKHDVDGASLTSRLSKLAPISFLNPDDGLTRRRMFSTDSWEPISFVYANDNPAGYAHEQVNYGGVAQPRFQFNSRFSPRASASFYAMNQVAIDPGSAATVGNYPANYLSYTHANPIATEFIPNPTLPMNVNPANLAATTGTSIQNYITRAGGPVWGLPRALDAGAMATSVFSTEYAVNAAPLANSALSSSSVPVQTPSLAHRDRRINLNFPLPISNDPAEPVRQKWIRDTYQMLKKILPPQSVDTPEELAALSQFVVNIIDFRDTDCTATRFVNTDIQLSRATDTTPTKAEFVSPTNVPAQPFAPGLYDPNSPTPCPYLVQHGMENSPVAINEALAYQTVYTGGAKNTRLYLELVNTLTKDYNPATSVTTAPVQASTDVNLKGWDIVVTPDKYGWGRPDPLTGDVSSTALRPARTQTGAAPGHPPQQQPAPLAADYPAGVTLDALKLVNGGTGLPGFIFSNNSTLTQPAPIGKVTKDPLVHPIDSDYHRPHYFILTNEMSASAVSGGEGEASIDAESVPIAKYDETNYASTNGDFGDRANTRVMGTFPDFATPYGKTLTGASNAQTYGAQVAPTSDPLAAGGGDGHFYWVYLRRPANPFDTANLTNAKPNREMVVVDAFRVLFIEGGTDGTTVGQNDIFSYERLQPYRGGHMVRGHNATPSHVYGFSEQTVPHTGGAGTNTGIQSNSNRTPRTDPIESTLGKVNSVTDDVWSHVPFHDRDFSSVAELLLVPGCPPGLFTKQFVEEPYPGNVDDTGGFQNGYNDANLPRNSGNIEKNQYSEHRKGRKNFVTTTSPPPNPAVPTFPYLPEQFYYSAASVAPPAAGTYQAGDTPRFPIELGGWTGNGWFKMMEFFEVPSSANGSIGPVANGVDFDWYRSDVKPGLMNLNLIIDEEAFFGIIDDERLNRKIAVAFAQTPPGDYYNFLPSVVTQVDGNGYPTELQPGTATTLSTFARYPISDVNTVNSGQALSYGPYGGLAGRGFVYRDPTLSTTLVHGLKAAFSDFLKIRHGGSGYLFAFGSGMPGSGGYIATNNGTNLAYNTIHAGPSFRPSPVASERPFRSLSYPDINYTILRPASLPPSTYNAATIYGGTPTFPSWSFPKIPITGDPMGVVLGLENLLSYTAAAFSAATNQYVTMGLAEAPNNVAARFQYVFDPGIQNPYLTRQYDGGVGGSPLPPYEPNRKAIPPTPFRRLFQVADTSGLKEKGTVPYATEQTSFSNASIIGAYDFRPPPLGPPPATWPVYLVNRYTSDSQLTTGDMSTLTSLGDTVSDLLVSPPSLVQAAKQYVLMPDNQTLDSRGRAPFLGGNETVGTDPSEKLPDNRQHPLYRTEWLQKIMNLTTVRTHQYAVWITVGFFEVVQQGVPEFGVADQLGGELDSAAGKRIRFRSFFVLDRTKAKGFNPYYPGDFRDVVTYRRRIE